MVNKPELQKPFINEQKKKYAEKMQSPISLTFFNTAPTPVTCLN